MFCSGFDAKTLRTGQTFRRSFGGVLVKLRRSLGVKASSAIKILFGSKMHFYVFLQKSTVKAWKINKTQTKRTKSEKTQSKTRVSTETQTNKLRGQNANTKRKHKRKTRKTQLNQPRWLVGVCWGWLGLVGWFARWLVRWLVSWLAGLLVYQFAVLR